MNVSASSRTPSRSTRLRTPRPQRQTTTPTTAPAVAASRTDRTSFSTQTTASGCGRARPPTPPLHAAMTGSGKKYRRVAGRIVDGEPGGGVVVRRRLAGHDAGAAWLVPEPHPHVLRLCPPATHHHRDHKPQAQHRRPHQTSITRRHRGRSAPRTPSALEVDERHDFVPALFAPTEPTEPSAFSLRIRARGRTDGRHRTSRRRRRRRSDPARARCSRCARPGRSSPARRPARRGARSTRRRSRSRNRRRAR